MYLAKVYVNFQRHCKCIHSILDCRLDCFVFFPDLSRTYTQDGVCLTESGLCQLQSLSATGSRRRKPKPKLKLKIINQNSVAVLQAPVDPLSEHSRDEDMVDNRGTCFLAQASSFIWVLLHNSHFKLLWSLWQFYNNKFKSAAEIPFKSSQNYCVCVVLIFFFFCLIFFGKSYSWSFTAGSINRPIFIHNLEKLVQCKLCLCSLFCVYCPFSRRIFHIIL